MPSTGKCAVVTGAAGNLGSALARLLASRGARVIAVDAAHDGLKRLSLSGSGHLMLPDQDLTDPSACNRIVEHALKEAGRIDLLACTVGGFAMAPLAESGPEQWNFMFGLNVTTTLNICRAVVPAMQAARSGSIVCVGSAAALRGGSQLGAYAATKSAVLRLVETMAAELRSFHIRVNAVLPTTMDTPQNRAAMPDADPANWVKPEQVAEVMAFLLSDFASAISGASIQTG
jgi:NAD(P)-dependent dehydrogenase (short-subunit alcohol dehydrogenase family)